MLNGTPVHWSISKIYIRVHILSSCRISWLIVSMASVIINSRLSDCAVIEILYAFVSGPFHRLPHTGIGSFLLWAISQFYVIEIMVPS